MSVIGCGRKSTPVQFCSAGDSGPVVGQVATIQLSESLSTIGESLNYGQIGQSLNASAFDCKGSSISVGSYTYATTDMTIADINPATGQVCAGTWNRNSGGGVPDYTFCTAPANPGNKFQAYVTASAAGATSNAIPVYIHPVVTSVAIGTPSTSCSTDPSSDCCTFNTPLQTGVSPYTGDRCLSQGATGQLVARVYAGTPSAANNITCKVGHLTFGVQGSSNIATIDPSTGVITANQPGSTTITATISNAGSGNTAGFFATCPPQSIVLSATGKTGPNITVPLNNAQTFTATVIDTNGKTITGLGLEFNSTTPQTIPASGSTVTPAFPGTATITAVCQPGICNPAPYSQIGLYGTGKPVTSNGITVTTAGTSSTVLYAGSTSSQYLYPVDFTTSQPASLVKLPYVPNSMVISQDGSSIYLGSSQALMTVNALNNTVGAANTVITGTVLALSPDGGTLVVSDAARQTISLVTTAGSLTATYGGVGTAAQFSPDSQTVYIAAINGQLLVHSNFSGWSALSSTNYSDVAVTVPHAGAYFAAGAAGTEGRSYCASSTVTAGNPPTVSNAFYPVADASAAPTQRIAATNDGNHIIGATVTPAAVLNDLTVVLPTQNVGGVTTINACPAPPAVVSPGYFASTFVTRPLTGVTATAINRVVPASNSALAFVTYTGASGLLPVYVPATKVLSFVPLSGGATAPVSGVFSSDNLTFYTGTSGDNRIHLVNVNGTTATETATPLSPNLPDANGAIVAPNLLVQRPKRSTS